MLTLLMIAISYFRSQIIYYRLLGILSLISFVHTIQSLNWNEKVLIKDIRLPKLSVDFVSNFKQQLSSEHPVWYIPHILYDIFDKSKVYLTPMTTFISL